MGFEGFTEIAILLRLLELTIHIHERIRHMPTPTSIAELQATVGQLQASINAFQPVLQASLDLTGVAVAKLEELFQLIQSMGTAPTPEQLQEISATIAAAKETISGDIASLNLRNAAVQNELEKINQPPTTGG